MLYSLIRTPGNPPPHLNILVRVRRKTTSDSRRLLASSLREAVLRCAALRFSARVKKNLPLLPSENEGVPNPSPLGLLFQPQPADLRILPRVPCARCQAGEAVQVGISRPTRRLSLIGQLEYRRRRKEKGHEAQTTARVVRAVDSGISGLTRLPRIFITTYPRGIMPPLPIALLFLLFSVADWPPQFSSGTDPAPARQGGFPHKAQPSELSPLPQIFLLVESH
jgi:hypothetical protein